MPLLLNCSLHIAHCRTLAELSPFWNDSSISRQKVSLWADRDISSIIHDQVCLSGQFLTQLIFLKFISTHFATIHHYDCTIGNLILFRIKYPAKNAKRSNRIKNIHWSALKGFRGAIFSRFPRYQLPLWKTRVTLNSLTSFFLVKDRA